MFDFSTNNYDSVWSVIIQIALLLIAILFGNALRRSIPFLKKSFIPAALLGGCLLAIANVISKKFFDYDLVNQNLMQEVTYHALAIGFIAITLKVSNKEKKNGLGVKSIQNGLITGATYMLQAAFGIATVLIFVLFGMKIFYGSGIILPLAFGQGPGNALTWDINFSSLEHMSKIGASETMDTNGSFGLALASIGFIVASIVGVIYINYYRIKGVISHDAIIPERKVEEFIDHNEIEDNESVDKLSIQLGIVGLCYLLTFGVMVALSFSDFTSSIAWGFNFLFGVVVATLVKSLFLILKKNKIVKKKYINNYQMDRISGFAFDLMITAGVAAIDINDIRKYILIILVLSVVGTIITYIYVRLLSKTCFKECQHEMFLVNFGTLTGTASNGMILLREIDPEYKTDASNVFVVSQFPAMITVAPLLFLLNFAAKSLKTCIISIFIFLALATIYTIINIIISKRKKKTN